MDRTPLAACGAEFGGKRLAAPPLDRSRITLMCTLQRILRGQSKPCKQVPNGTQTKLEVELALDQLGNERAGLKAEVQAILAWILAINSAKHLLLLARRQTTRPADRRPRLQGLQPHARIRCRGKPILSRRAAEPVGSDHSRRRLASPHPLYRHQPNGKIAGEKRIFSPSLPRSLT